MAEKTEVFKNTSSDVERTIAILKKKTELQRNEIMDHNALLWEVKDAILRDEDEKALKLINSFLAEYPKREARSTIELVVAARLFSIAR